MEKSFLFYLHEILHLFLQKFKSRFGTSNLKGLNSLNNLSSIIIIFEIELFLKKIIFQYNVGK